MADDMNKYISDEGMPKYQRKVDTDAGVETVEVRAVKIVDVSLWKGESGRIGTLCVERPFAPRDVSRMWCVCWAPEPGGYFVINDSLGGLNTYESAEQFENRYARAPVADLTMTAKGLLAALDQGLTVEPGTLAHRDLKAALGE